MSQSGPSRSFPETRWSRVVRIRSNHGADEAGAKALAELCEIYWFPLYVFARRCGRSPEDAEDLTQGFFNRLIEREWLSKADPERGRLRSFLLVLFKRFMSETQREALAQRRGGNHTIISLDGDGAEEQYSAELVDASTPETLYERSWFKRILQVSLDRLEQEYLQRGKGELFRQIQNGLAWNSAEHQTAELARELLMSPGAVRVAVFRMRERFSQILEEIIAQTTASDAETQEELAHLQRVLSH